MRSEGGAKTVNITEVKVSGPGDTIDVRLKRESAVEDDTQTLNLRGGGNWRVVNGDREGVNFGKSGFGAEKKKFCFVTVKFEKI